MRVALLIALASCSESNLTSLPGDEAPGTTPANPKAPIADAGADQAVAPGELATVDGSASHDPGGRGPLVYQWTLVSWPDGSSVQVDGLDQAQATVHTDVAGDYSLSLTVENSAGLWDETPDDVVVTATAPSGEPVADAGPDQTVAPLATITLDGTASYDPLGLSLIAFQWRIVSQPSGSTSALSSTTVARPTIFADLAGDYVFELDVENSDGVWDSTPDQVVVSAVPLDSFYVQLSWNSGADLDLHLLEEGGKLFDSPTDCNYCDQTPAWGPGGAADNPSLDWDAIFGWGPETITIDAPADGVYTIAVHYYGKDGSPSCVSCPSSDATVDVYIDGSLAASYTNTLVDDGDLWTVATIDWPSGVITDVDNLGVTDKVTCF